MSFRVREGQSADVSEMERVYQQSWRGAYEPFLDPTALERLAADRARSFDWQRGILAPDSHVLVADDDSTIVGVALATEVLDPPRDLPEILMLYVDPQHWGWGVATALMDAELRWLAERGHPLARLRVVEAHLRARRFYEREGWEPDSAIEPVSTDLATLVYYRRRTARAVTVPHDDIDGCRLAHIRLGEVVHGLGDDDVARPSALPDWTVGHVLVHLTQNARAMQRRIDAATRSEVVEQYPGGPAGRTAAIERAAQGPPDEIRREVVDSAEQLDRAFAGLDERVWARPVRTVAGTEHPVGLLPYRRWREVEVHLVDLGRGVTPQNWPDGLVDRSLTSLLAGLADRADDRALMAWLLGRGPAPDLDPWG